MRINIPKPVLLLLAVLLLTTPRASAQHKLSVEDRIDSLNKTFNEVFTKDLDQAEKLVNEALQLSIQSGYLFGEATARSNQSAYFLKKEGHTKALEVGFAALRIYDKQERFKNSFEYGNLYIRLAKSFFMEKDYERSKAYGRQAIEVANKIKDQHLLALAYEHLGNNFSMSMQVDSALHYYNKAKEDFIRTNYYTGLANVANNIGAMYSDKTDNQKAIQYFTEAVSIYHKNGIKSSLTTGHYNIGYTYYMLKSYKQALFYADSSVYYALQFKRPNSLIKSYMLLAQIYQGLGNADSSAAYYEKTIALKDSTQNDTYKKELATLQTQSDIYKPTTENQLLSKDNRIAVLYRNLAIAGIASLIIVLGFFLISQRLRIQRRVKNQLEEEVALRTKEIFHQKETIFHTNLRLKLALNGATFDSHFAVNILNTIQEDILKKSPAETQVNLARLSHLIQYVLEKTPLERVPLTEELQMAELYIQLEQLRMHHRFNYTIINKAGAHTTIPATLLQPFIENAIIQGLIPAKGDNLQLTIETAIQDDMLTVSITDNGVDRRKEKLNKYNPRGSKSGQERMDLLTHLTHKNHLAIFEDLSTTDGFSNGTKIVLQLPLEGEAILQELAPLEDILNT